MNVDEKADKVEVGPTLDAWIAEHVMGWIPWYGTDPDWVGFFDGEWLRWTKKPTIDPDDPGEAEVWSPSTDIAAAWMVVEKLFSITGGTVGIRQHSKHVCVQLITWKRQWLCDTSLPAAVCKAAFLFVNTKMSEENNERKTTARD